MKKEYLLVVASFFLMSVSMVTGVYAIDKDQKEKIVTISKQNSDITGDGQFESIELKGVPYEEDDNFLKDIYIKVSTNENRKYKIPLESGTKAAVKLIDIDNDGVKELLANVYTGGNEGSIKNYLFSLKDGIRNDLTVPEPIEMDSHFENGYKAKLTVKSTGKTYLFDLKDRKKYYKKLGLYYKGKLNEPTELTVNSFSTLKPLRTSNGGMGLKGIQRISGIANADTIAYVESTWNYQGGKWNLVDTTVRKEQEKGKKK